MKSILKSKLILLSVFCLFMVASCTKDDDSPQEFTVTFNTQGGSNLAAITAKESAKITKPTDPTKTGNIFAGWFKDAATMQSFDFSTATIEADITLYAKWTTEVFTVSFDSQGGSDISAVPVEFNTKLTKPTDPTDSSGKVFMGWYTDMAFTNKFNFETELITADITLYANWGYQPADKAALQNLITNDVKLDEIDVSLVTDMSNLFYEKTTPFNGSIANWDVSNVTDMSFMFYFADFNQDISNWDVSNVTTMYYMFPNSSFNQDISNWDVSNVTDMSFMFRENASFNQDIGNWDVSNVTTMSYMFLSTPFNQDISNWDVSSVTDMSAMFDSATSFNQDISAWDVSSVTNMSSMFSRCFSFNQNLNEWDVSSVTDMSAMFSNAISFNQDISNWDVSSVTNMTYMFYNIFSFTQDLTDWQVACNVNINGMFKDTSVPNDKQDIRVAGCN